MGEEHAQTPVVVTLCLVCDDTLMEAAVRVNCPPPHRVDRFSADNIVNAQNSLSEQGEKIVAAAAEADAVLVEWSLEKAPVINTLCYHVRRALYAPVIALCRGSEAEQVAAIAAGADSALSLPFYLPAIKAKAFAYRRLTVAAQAAFAADGQTTPAVARDIRQFGPLQLDRTSHQFFINGREVDLTPREFALIDHLVANAAILCTRDQILDQVWGINFDTGTNMVDVYMHFLRRKLEANGVDGMIHTVRGHGYRLVLPESTGDP